MKKSAQHFSANRLLTKRPGGGLICAVSSDDLQFSPVFLGFADTLSALLPSFYCPDHLQISANSFYKHPGCSILGDWVRPHEIITVYYIRAI